MIQLMHLFLTSMAEGIFCDFCADTTRTIAQKTTVNVTDSNILRLCIIMARKYTFFRPCSVIFHKGRDDASYSCVPLARCPRALSAHPTLRPNGLMWGYWDNVPLARIVRFVTNIIIPFHITRRASQRHKIPIMSIGGCLLMFATQPVRAEGLGNQCGFP